MNALLINVVNRYSGRTQKELVEFVRENYVTPAPFQRCAYFPHCFVGQFCVVVGKTSDVVYSCTCRACTHFL